MRVLQSHGQPSPQLRAYDFMLPVHCGSTVLAYPLIYALATPWQNYKTRPSLDLAMSAVYERSH